MKIFVTLTLLLTILCISTSCSVKEAQQTNDSTILSTAETSISEETKLETEPLPIVDYGGDEFVILVNDRSDDYRSVEFAAEEMDGSLLNDAVYDRNLKIETLYNVDIVNHKASDEPSVLRKSVLANETTFDIALIPITYCGALALDRLLADYNEFPYLNLEAEHWDRNALKRFSLNKKLYIALGDMNINDKDMTWCLFFNKNLAVNYNLPDIYSLANDKKWTFDIFSVLCQNVSNDLNGDGIYDDNDLWGHVTVFARSTIAYMYSMGAEYIKKDSADLPVLNFGDERIYEAYDKVHALFFTGNTCHDVETMPFSGYAHQWRKCEAMFGAEQILFYGEAMQNAERFRSFETDFGILPLPSYEEEGVYGNNMLWHQSYATVIPLTTISSDEKLTRAGLLLEAIQAESHSTVLEAYYEKALKSKFSRDEKSADMIDIIFKNRYIDIATYYGWGKASDKLMAAGKNGDENIVSLFASIESATQADIDITVQKLEENK